MVVRAAAAAMLGLGLARWACGDAPDAPGPDDGAPSVAALVDRLGSESFADRLDAQERLTDLTDRAKPYLTRAVEGSPNPEVRVRADQVLRAIDQLTGPTPITLSSDPMTVRDALEEVGTAARLRFHIRSSAAAIKADEAKVKLDADGRPLWELVGDLCGRLGVRPTAIYPASRDVILEQASGGWSAQLACASGPCLFLIDHRTRPADAPPELAFSIFPEPKLQAAAVEQVRLDRCESADGQALAAPHDLDVLSDRDPSNGESLDGCWRARMGLPANKAPARIAGIARLLLATRAADYVLSDATLAAEAEATLHGIRLIVHDCLQTDRRQWTVRLSVYRDARDAADWDRLAKLVTHSAPEVFDIVGRRLRPPDNGHWTVLADRCDLNYDVREVPSRFARGVAAQPQRLRWAVPYRATTISIPFHFDDLPPAAPAAPARAAP